MSKELYESWVRAEERLAAANLDLKRFEEEARLARVAFCKAICPANMRRGENVVASVDGKWFNVILSDGGFHVSERRG